MNQENIGQITFEDKEKMNPITSEIIDTVNPITEIQNNQLINCQNNNEAKGNQINKSSNEPIEDNIIKNIEENKKENNHNNLNNINENNNYNDNDINSNVNYMSQNIQSDNNELNNSKSKNIKIQEIIVGNRRIERYDGAEYNNQNENKQNQAQFDNNQLVFPEQFNINGFDNSEFNFIPINAYNQQIQQSSFYNNINEIQSQVQFDPQFQNNIPYPLNLNQNQVGISNNNNSPKNDEYINNNFNHQCNQIYQNTLNNTQISQEMNPEYFEIANREKMFNSIPPEYNQKNISVKVLYPKPGYGNSEEVQNKLKKKKKKKIKYVRRLKPLIEQHFDMQINQTEEEINIPSIYQPYLEQHQHRNNFPIEQTFRQKFIPHIPNKYKIRKFAHPKSKLTSQDFLNYDESLFDYNSTGEQERSNIYYNSACKQSPRQTIINITPMRTINRWNSISIPYNNGERKFKTEGYKSYMHMTPSRYIDNENTYYTLERYGYSSDEPSRKGTISFFSKNIDDNNSNISYNENEEMSSEMMYPSLFSDTIMRMRNNY